MKHIIPTNGMIIETDTIFAPGVYHLPDGIRIGRSGVRLEGNGAILVGSDKNGIGLHLVGVDEVSVSNLGIQNYYHGVVATNCSQLQIEHCTMTQTAELPPGESFLDIWKPASDPYGGGIYLSNVTHSVIRHNDLQHQMYGILAYHCRHLAIRENIANYCSGAGIYLHQVTTSQIAYNQADFCCRYEARGRDARQRRIGHMGADAAGIVMVYGCCYNTVQGNMARMSGDGFFVAGLHPNGEHVGCDHNRFVGNDGSYSPNIAFEATFSRGNFFFDNVASYCNYGFWLGFSAENEISENEISWNRQAGIAVENGVKMQALRNNLRHNRCGILLWSKHVPMFAKSVPENDTSRDWLIAENRFAFNQKGVRIAPNQDHGIRPMGPSHQSAPPLGEHRLAGNRFEGNGVDQDIMKDEG